MNLDELDRLASPKEYIPCDGICGNLVWKMTTVIVYPGEYYCLKCWSKFKDCRIET